jgi:hypothetical protein
MSADGAIWAAGTLSNRLLKVKEHILPNRTEGWQNFSQPK